MDIKDIYPRLNFFLIPHLMFLVLLYFCLFLR